MDETNIWYVEFKEVNNIVNKLQMVLSDEELNKSNNFLKNTDKNNYIISHAFLRILLTYYYPNIKPEVWTFEENKYGKPMIAKKHQIKLYFNLSHTYSYAAIILSTLGECGIDIEEDRGMVLDDNLIDLVLTKKEKYLYFLKKRREVFYMLWTLKEAYLKAEGLGFAISPKKVDFTFLSTIDKEKKVFIENNYQYGTQCIFNNIYLSYALKDIEKEKLVGKPTWYPPLIKASNFSSKMQTGKSEIVFESLCQPRS